MGVSKGDVLRRPCFLMTQNVFRLEDFLTGNKHKTLTIHQARYKVTFFQRWKIHHKVKN